MSSPQLTDVSIGSERDTLFRLVPAQHAEVGSERTGTLRFPVKHSRSTRKIQDWHLKVHKPIVFIGDSNLARIPQFHNPLVQFDSFPGANFLHIAIYFTY